jgi:hypothetical protein
MQNFYEIDLWLSGHYEDNTLVFDTPNNQGGTANFDGILATFPVPFKTDIALHLHAALSHDDHSNTTKILNYSGQFLQQPSPCISTNTYIFGSFKSNTQGTTDFLGYEFCIPNHYEPTVYQSAFHTLIEYL